MKNLWSDREAAATVKRYAKMGVNRDVALRVYTTRLLGKIRVGYTWRWQYVSQDTRPRPHRSGTGRPLRQRQWLEHGDIEPPGLPAVRHEPLRELAALEALSDEDMVNTQRGNLLDSTSPNPSVETLLHAFLPHKFIDHTHSNAVLALTDQPDGEDICRELYGDRAALVPYIMPGFALAKKAMEIQAANPECEGLILLKHGVFSFGGFMQEAYRDDPVVTMAERRISKAKRSSLSKCGYPRS